MKRSSPNTNTGFPTTESNVSDEVSEDDARAEASNVLEELKGGYFLPAQEMLVMR